LVFIGLVGTSEGFIVPSSSSSATASSSSTSVLVDSPSFVRNLDVTTLNAVPDILNAGVPAAIFGAAVYATVAKSDKVVEEGTTSSVAPPPPPTPPPPEPVVEEETVVEEEEEETVAEVEPEPEPEPVVAAVEPAPAPAPAPAPRDIGKEITELRKQVASTLDGEKEKLDRMKAAAEKKEEAVVKEIVKPRETTTTTKAVVSGGVTAKPQPTNGKKRRFVKRLVKKIAMPWKKWSDIS